MCYNDEKIRWEYYLQEPQISQKSKIIQYDLCRLFQRFYQSLFFFPAKLVVFPWVSIFKAFPVVFILELIDLKLISNSPLNSLFFPSLDYINPLCANPTKWSNTIKQFVDNSWRIVWVCLTILCVWPIKG